MNHYGMGSQLIENYRPLHECLPSNQIMDLMSSAIIASLNGLKACYLKGIG